MRVLAHIHTFNDADIIDRTIDAVLRQTRPVDEVLVVDNASTDGTLEQQSLKHATVLRHPENRGTSGTVYSGFCYAIEHDYDWIWVFDADSVPEPDALEQLLALYAGFPPALQDETAFVACLPRNTHDEQRHHGGFFTRRGLAPSWPVPESRHYPAHWVIWSGCLYRLAAVRKIGLPNPNYVLDWGEGEYGYRIMKAGYKGFVHQDAVLYHNIRGQNSMTPVEVKLGAAKLTLYEFPPIRCYYTCRNVPYFGLYDFQEERLYFMRAIGWRVFRMPLGFMLRPRTHARHILACIRGLWHGFTGNIAARY
jgi:rhamnosyltransferase